MSKPSQSAISDELLDSLFKNYEKPEDFFGNSGILEELIKRVIERALQVELAHHLGHEKHGNLEIDILRDRQGSFEPLSWSPKFGQVC